MASISVVNHTNRSTWPYKAVFRLRRALPLSLPRLLPVTCSMDPYHVELQYLDYQTPVKNSISEFPLASELSKEIGMFVYTVLILSLEA